MNQRHSGAQSIHTFRLHSKQIGLEHLIHWYFVFLFLTEGHFLHVFLLAIFSHGIGNDIPMGTKKYFQSPISTSAHAPIDIELMERADSSENTIWKNSVGINTKNYHVFAPMGSFQLESIYLYFPPSSQLLYLCFCAVGLSLL